MVWTNKGKWPHSTNHVVFPFSRRVFMMSYHHLRCGKSSHRNTETQLQSIKKELGDEVGAEGESRPEVVTVRDNLDAQSQILCGISKV